MTRPLTVLKLGGELLQDQDRLRDYVAAIARLSASGPLVVVHGGGREIDAELARRGLEPLMVDGLRVTDDAALDTVVAVLAGSINTRFVAALTAAGVRAVGLTGVDDGMGLSEKVAPLGSKSGVLVNLGRVGAPVGTSAPLVTELCQAGFVPVVASIGVDASGQLLNVNADTLAAHLAGVAGASRLLIAGGTPGVVDRAGHTIARVDVSAVDALGADGTVSGGMLAKLEACRQAVRAGVGEVMIVDGSNPDHLVSPIGTVIDKAGSRPVPASGTYSVRSADSRPLKPSSCSMDAMWCRCTGGSRSCSSTAAARGCTDAEGREYINLVSGVGVASLGHSHPRLIQALTDQAGRLMHTSNLYFQAQQARLAGRLAEISGLPRAFFCNSGAEAVEACLKFARRYWHRRETPRKEIVALEGSFHGRTFGALSVTWDPHYREPFAPLLEHIVFVPANDAEALTAAVSERTCAVILKPIQGEGGVRALTPEFAESVDRACRRTGALLIADEVQCGLGRTGVPFYSAELGLRPISWRSARLSAEASRLAQRWPAKRWPHRSRLATTGSTYGGNLLACHAGLVFVEELIDRNLIGHVKEVAAHLDGRLRTIASRREGVVNLLGVGLMRGLEMDVDAAPVVEAARLRGVLVNRTATRVVRLLPALTISRDELNLGIDRLAEALQDVTAEVRA